MEYITGSTDFKLESSAVTLGKFDGIHLGHRYLIEQVVSYRDKGLRPVVFSLIANKGMKHIYTEQEKRIILEACGVDTLVSCPFTDDIKNMEPEEFIRDVLAEKLDVRIIVVGEDFRFGRNRRGDASMLKSYADKYGYKVIACTKKRIKGRIVSSSSVRAELEKGNIEAANAMLGMPYSIYGKVMHGRKIGRTLGMPTVNLLPPQEKLLPISGVYASVIYAEGGIYEGVTNIGYKPSVGAEKQIGAETFMFDYDKELYGEDIKVELHSFHRPEYRFASMEELKSAMHADIDYARKYFKSKSVR
jgi:riboflavin kinase/FMN adenylyltransferase